MPFAVLAFVNERITEVVLAVAIVFSLDIQGLVLCPCLEVRRSGEHYHLTALGRSRLVFVACVECVVELVCLVVYGASRSDCRILVFYASAFYQFSHGYI